MKTRTWTLGRLLVLLLILLACRFTADETADPTALQPDRTFTPVPVERSTPTAQAVQPTRAATRQAVTPTIAPTPAPAAYGVEARQYLVALSDDMDARIAGSPQEAQAAAYIARIFEQYGYRVQMQPFTFFTEDDQELDSANVIAVKPGRSTQEIIVGAHYDSVDDARGADDNASGVAVLLQAAALLQNVQTPYTIRLVAFGAEEVDMDGSRYYVEQMDRAAIRNTVAMINLDSLIAGDRLYVYGDAGPGSLRDWIIQKAAGLGFDLESRTAQELDDPDGEPCDCADYGPFQEAGIPFAYFEATNWDLGEQDGMTQVALHLGQQGEIRHTRYDTIAYLDATFPGRIDHHLNVFVTLLYHALTQFQAAP